MEVNAGVNPVTNSSLKCKNILWGEEYRWVTYDRIVGEHPIGNVLNVRFYHVIKC